MTNESTRESEWYFMDGSRSEGPVTSSRLGEFFSADRISGKTLVSAGGPWIQLRQSSLWAELQGKKFSVFRPRTYSVTKKGIAIGVVAALIFLAQFVPDPGVQNFAERNKISVEQAKTLISGDGSIGDYEKAKSLNLDVSSYAKYKKQLGMCRDDWHSCKDNEQLMDNYGRQREISFACVEAAKKQAKFGTPEFPWAYPFARYYSGDNGVKTGVLRVFETDAKFENGFGAKVNSKVECVYDLNSSQVITISVSPR
jgi:hypothetical protein